MFHRRVWNAIEGGYKSRDESRGTYYLLEIAFQILRFEHLICSRQQKSSSVILYGFVKVLRTQTFRSTCHENFQAELSQLPKKTRSSLIYYAQPNSLRTSLQWLRAVAKLSTRARSKNVRPRDDITECSSITWSCLTNHWLLFDWPIQYKSLSPIA